MINGYVRFRSIRVIEQHIGEDSMQSEVTFEYEVQSREQLGLIAFVKSPAGGTFEKDMIEVVLPTNLELPINYQAFRDAVEEYYRQAIGSRGWAILIEQGATGVISETVATAIGRVIIGVDAAPGPTVTAEDCAKPAIEPPGPDSPFVRLQVVEGIDFKGQDVFLDGRKFRDCTFTNCKLHFDFGAFLFQVVTRQTTFDGVTFVPGPRAKAIMWLKDLVDSQNAPSPPSSRNLATRPKKKRKK